MKPSAAIAAARVILNDPDDAGDPRWAADELLGYYNDYRKALAQAKGELFQEVVSLNLVDGDLQTVSRTETFGIVDVLKNKIGDAVHEVDRKSLELSLRGWRKEAKTPAKAWARMSKDPFKFVVFPPARVADVLTAIVVAVPADIELAAINDDDGLSLAYRASAGSYVAGRALMVNTNAADTQKGSLLLQGAMGLAGVAS